MAHTEPVGMGGARRKPHRCLFDAIWALANAVVQRDLPADEAPPETVRSSGVPVLPSEMVEPMPEGAVAACGTPQVIFSMVVNGGAR